MTSEPIPASFPSWLSRRLFCRQNGASPQPIELPQAGVIAPRTIIHYWPNLRRLVHQILHHALGRITCPKTRKFSTGAPQYFTALAQLSQDQFDDTEELGNKTIDSRQLYKTPDLVYVLRQFLDMKRSLADRIIFMDVTSKYAIEASKMRFVYYFVQQAVFHLSKKVLKPRDSSLFVTKNILSKPYIIKSWTTQSTWLLKKLQKHHLTRGSSPKKQWDNCEFFEFRTQGPGTSATY